MNTVSNLRSSILIVDDVPTNIQVLLNVLKDDYDLLSATSGRQALSLLESDRKPDLILLDVMMPEMDGYELCVALKQDAATREIPVIFITSKSDAESEAEGLSTGAVDFIRKPINREVVLARVALHLRQNQRAKELHLENNELAEWNSNLKSRVLQQTALIRKKLQEAHQQSDHTHQYNDAVIGPVLSSPPNHGVLLPDQPLSILCVDDEVNILNSLRRLFHKEPFRVLTASSGKEGLAILKQTENIGLILSDHRMPEMTGTEFLQAATAISPDSSRMIMTGYADMNTAIQAINHAKAISFQTKPWEDQELLQLVRDGVQQYRTIREARLQEEKLTKSNAVLKARILQQTETIREHLENNQLLHDKNQDKCESIVFLLADLLDQRHRRLSRHSRNVAELTKSMVMLLNLSQSQREEIIHAALLHDIGLIGVADRVLLNNMELLIGDDVAEYRDHSIRGQKLIDTFEELQGIGLHIRHHHEAFDGSGFPDGLEGEEISLGGRIIHLASYIDKNYTPLTGVNAKYYLSRKVASCLGTLFDPALGAAANHAVLTALHDPSVGSPFTAEQKTAITSLQVGMVLTQNIYSTSGALVMEGGRRLTHERLNLIQQHQHLDAPTNTVWIRKSTC